ncbi:uncharacterized protein LOC142318315 [Lycorma delicatula]|uniref:uncharacterized protein LOC142318315 n=1 Tax=Lycorma delicatula TaxID=130591 RepID=UPI003F5160FA
MDVEVSKRLLFKQFLRITVIFFLIIKGVFGLHYVNIEVPSEVKRGSEVTLRCLYDLQEKPLYCVKWYRGTHEFYRYSPGEAPTKKLFPFPGITVDLSQSNETQVVLENVGPNLSGNISCEVTSEAPNFSSNTASSTMSVKEIPEHAPNVETEKKSYDVGEILRANCTSPPASPPATLSFFLNDMPVGEPDARWFKSIPDGTLQWSFLSLNLPLESHHFQQNQLILRCTAIVGTLYRQSYEVSLSSKQREPVPERVTSPNLTSRTSTTSVHLTLFFAAWMVAR